MEHLFIQQALSTYYVPGTVSLLWQSLHFSKGVKQTINNIIYHQLVRSSVKKTPVESGKEKGCRGGWWRRAFMRKRREEASPISGGKSIPGRGTTGPKP